ncbi:MAG: hypothetical protein C0504_00930 [Candidatus Solibacter sp.]|nr:hypothetical protein [Candidatus Solibacter sp.]
MKAEESGSPLASLPEGVYGFTTSAATTEVAVFDKPVFRSFEVHKLQGGEILYLGYMNEADLKVFESGAEPVSVDLYPDPHEPATHLAGVPESRITRKRPPLRDQGSPMKLQIAATR